MNRVSSWSEAYLNKIISPKILVEKAALWHKEQKQIVTLNGSFDLLHAGHLEIIYEAAQLGDLLLVALNTDRSIQNYKSPSRPIIPLSYRLQMMAALSFVDYLTWFDEIDPRNWLEIVKPSIHVNGSEYGENCVEAEVVKKHGGKLHLVKLVPGLSTSQIIQKIRETENI